MKRKPASRPAPSTNRPKPQPARSSSELLTFREHLQELRNRLFWVAIIFLLASAAAYPFFDTILAVLVKPLGDLPLHYLTPVGGFGFILKVCMYAGALAAVPMVVYQLFRYIQPVMRTIRGQIVAIYMVASTLLAITGATLAYLFSLPAALHFLTGFELPQITAMLTADSYFSFVMTYLLAAAILFQLPLILLIINNITPLNPGSLMKLQRYVIVVAFILAAVISPTPDALNQLLLAGPIIAMYQVGIVLVIAHNYIRKKRSPHQPAAPLTFKKASSPSSQPQSSAAALRKRVEARRPLTPKKPMPAKPSPASPQPSVFATQPQVPLSQPRRHRRSIDGFAIDA